MKPDITRRVVRVMPPKNSEPEKDLTIADEDDTKGEKVLKISPDEKKNKKSVIGGFRTTRFFRNRNAEKDLTIVDEEAPKGEKVLKISPPKTKKKHNFFFKLSTSEAERKKKSTIAGFRTSRFFRNRKSESTEDDIAPTAIAEELGDQLEKQENEEEAIKLKHAKPHPSDGRTHDLGVSELLNNKQDWVDLEDVWGTHRRWVPMGWFVLVVLSILCAGGWAIYQVHLAQPDIQEVIYDSKAYLEALEKENQEVKALDASMQACVKGYLSADSVATLLPYVRFPERVEPLMLQYYGKYGRRKTEFRYFEKMRSLNIGKRSFVKVQVELESGQPYHLLLEHMEDDTFRVDWESDVFYMPMSWKDYCEKRPLQPMDLRVKVVPDDFYGFAFRDKSRYQCYKISSLGSDQFLYAYAEKGSTTAYQLSQYFEKYGIHPDPKGKTMILRTRFLLEDESMLCVKIDQLICIGWAYIEASDALFTEPSWDKSPEK